LLTKFFFVLPNMTLSFTFCSLYELTTGEDGRLIHFPLNPPSFEAIIASDSRLILTLLCDSLSLAINAFTYRDCWGHGSGERNW